MLIWTEIIPIWIFITNNQCVKIEIMTIFVITKTLAVIRNIPFYIDKILAYRPENRNFHLLLIE